MTAAFHPLQLSVLIIALDEDRAFYRTLVTQLDSPSFSITFVKDAAEASSLLSKCAVDCVLLDYRRFDYDGLKLMPELASYGAPIPCIVVLPPERAGVQFVVEMLRQGAHDVLDKSLLTPQSLRRAIDDAAKARVRTPPLPLDAIFESIAEALITTDATGVVTFINATAQDLINCSGVNALGRPIQALVSTFDLSSFTNPIEVALSGGEVVQLVNCTLRLNNGSEITIDGTVSPIRDVGGIVMVFRDCSERKKEEDLLRESEARLSAILENTKACIYEMDTEGRVVHVNNHFETLFDLNVNEARGKSLYQLFPPDVAARLEETNQAVLRGGQPIEIEERAPHADGWHTYISIKAPHFDARGRTVGIVGISSDITERKRAEEQLRKSEEELQAIYHGTREYIGLLTPDGTLLKANRASLEFGNFTPDEVIGLPFWETKWFKFTPGAPELVKDAVIRAAAGEVVSFESRIMSPVGQEMFFDLSFYPVRNDSGEVILIVPEGRDITDLKRATEELRENQKELALALSASAMGVWSWNLRTDVVDWSDENYEIFGITEFEGTVDAFARTLHPDDVERVLNTVKGAIANRAPYESEFRIIRGDGSIRWVANRGRADFAPDGEPLRMLGVVMDIDAKKQAEIALSRSETQLRNALEIVKREQTQLEVILKNLPVGVMVTDAAGVALTLNKALRDIWRGERPLDSVEKYSQYQAWDLDTGQTLSPEDWPISRALARGQIQHDVEIGFRRFDDSTGVLSVSAVPIKNELNETTGGVAVAQDITARKDAERALRESEEFNRTVLESSPDCVKVLDLDGKLLTMNRPGCLLMEIDDLSRLRHHNWWELWPVESYALIKEAVSGAVRGQTVRFQAFCPTAKGTPKWWDVIVKPVRSSDGRVTRLVATSRDISERKIYEAERELLLAQEQEARAVVEKAIRTKDEFLAVVSHELRNPLNCIMGYARMISSKPQSPEQVSQIGEIIERNAKIQQQLIEDLLDSARIISGKLTLNLATIDLRLVLEDALAVVRTVADAKEIKFEINADHELQVIGDPSRLQQVIWNLLQNAIKFTPNGGHVSIKMDRNEENVRLVITDTGEGIETDFLGSIFERFLQKDMTSNRRFGGLGLGLSLVKELVEMHGGSVKAESPGKGLGSTFTVSIPRAPVKSLKMGSARDVGPDFGLPHHELPRLDGVSILVVDDQEDALLMLASALDELGAVVTTAASGFEAEKLLEQKSFDILVSDIAMPELDGYELVRRIRERERSQGKALTERIPAIALTTLIGTTDRLRALSAGFQTHVPKPIEMSELVIVIASLIRSDKTKDSRA